MLHSDVLSVRQDEQLRMIPGANQSVAFKRLGHSRSMLPDHNGPAGTVLPTAAVATLHLWPVKTASKNKLPTT